MHTTLRSGAKGEEGAEAGPRSSNRGADGSPVRDVQVYKDNDFGHRESLLLTRHHRRSRLALLSKKIES